MQQNRALNLYRLGISASMRIVHVAILSLPMLRVSLQITGENKTKRNEKRKREGERKININIHMELRNE